jgi:hypothetical protein
MSNSRSLYRYKIVCTYPNEERIRVSHYYRFSIRNAITSFIKRHPNATIIDVDKTVSKYKYPENIGSGLRKDDPCLTS